MDQTELDREICLCFHVTLRKVLHFIRVEKPRRASQLSECFGAGTGCGWCRPYLCQLFETARESQPNVLPPAEVYAEQRRLYRAKRASGSGEGPDASTKDTK